MNGEEPSRNDNKFCTSRRLCVRRWWMARDEELMSHKSVVVKARQSYKIKERLLLLEEAIVDERIDTKKKQEMNGPGLRFHWHDERQ